MPAVERVNERLLFVTLAALMSLIFIADLVTDLGTAVWIVYLLPIALALLTSRPLLPAGLAFVATILVVIDFVFGPSGIDPSIAAINRSLGVLAGWIIGVAGYFLIRARLDVQRHEWLQRGEVGLSESMRGEQSVDELGESILGYLASYIGAEAGALFVQDGKDYVRWSTYGVPAGAAIAERVKPGDGLLWRAVRDQRSFKISEIPEGYLYFGSGLGRAKPRDLFIAPAIVDGDVNAILEFGVARRNDRPCTELLHRVSSSIGIAVRSAKYRARLHELLDETRQQAEELQAQSEELKTANEELEEHTSALQESQTKLEAQQAELEQSNTQLEEYLQQLEAQRDELARAQSGLQEQARKLDLASRYKSEFLANMSHELRTPLNSLLILARLLAENRDGNLSPDQVRFAQTIEVSGNDLLLLINDILDLSRIEAGRLEIEPAELQIADLLQKLSDAFQTTAKEKGLELRTEIASDVAAIETDPQRIEQVIKNFLSNALKFTERGEVVLRVEPAAGDCVAFSVRDTGIGIPLEQQEIIFEAFRQVDGSARRSQGGTGLGLSISRELARLIGGSIQLSSAPGKGSTFTLVVPRVFDPTAAQSQPTSMAGIPISPPPSVPSRSEPPADLLLRSQLIDDDREKLVSGRRTMLVVEDDAAFARILYDLAHELGFQCVVAATADEGVAAASQYLPHAVILDMELPDHSGLTVLDRLKRDTRTRHIPVHVVSVSDYTQAAMAFGAVGYLLKPVKREMLIQELEKIEARFTQRVRRVLIVEDDPVQLESVRLLLASRDIVAEGAGTAAAALAKLNAESYDCIVLDLSLPDASGFDFIESLSRLEGPTFPPVIVYTGRDLAADEEMRLRKYSRSIIIKGAKSPERLLDEVTLFLHQVVSDLSEPQQQMLARSLNRDATLEGRQILVVEDDVRNVYALTSVFEHHGAAVTIARNGREAIRALEVTSNNGARPIDLVLMDIMMPEMDGLEATREIRSRSQWNGLPIIALTAKAMPDDQEQCLAAGANDYLAKPLDVDKLLSLARVWMSR